jgi:hypothetical protein
MSSFYIGLAAGLFIGAIAGFFFTGLLMIAREADERSRKFQDPTRTFQAKLSDLRLIRRGER